MKSLILAVVLSVITISSIYVYSAMNNQGVVTNDIPAPVDPIVFTQESNNIEVAFVLDTTGSMSGLIQGAKDNIWSIASSMASAQSSPTIRMGLVAFRDRGDDYVTQVVDLNEDLDTNYGKLMDFQAAGGGDGPESVNKALYDAVNSMSWSQDDNTYRVIFLVGDAEPHMDYKNEMQYPEIVKLAQSKGIVINTIQCGNMPETTKSWKAIAQLAQGDYFQVSQSGSAVAVSTPYDDQIASLAREMDGTRMYYGDTKTRETKRAKVAASDKFNDSASSSAIARKAEFNVSKSGTRNFIGDNELVDDVANERIDLSSVDKDKLPQQLQELSLEERTAVVKEKATKRNKLKQKIAELSAKRTEFIKEELAKTDKDEDSLDNQIYQTVKTQASEKGLVYERGGAKY